MFINAKQQQQHKHKTKHVGRHILSPIADSGDFGGGGSSSKGVVAGWVNFGDSGGGVELLGSLLRGSHRPPPTNHCPKLSAFSIGSVTPRHYNLLKL
jgi:hypothetical protein